MWYVYIVMCSDETYYTGISTDIIRRVKQHNTGRGAKYTSMRMPVKLIYLEEYNEQTEARKREIVIKDYSRKKKEGLINNISHINNQLLLDKLVEVKFTSRRFGDKMDP